MSVVIQMESTASDIPSEDLLQRWAAHVLKEFENTSEVTIRVVEREEMQSLNRDFRKQDKLTNVLSFPVEDEHDIEHGVLGDIVICAPVIADEAATQEKPLHAHWAHMVMHGVLHLLGFDHIESTAAEEMETHERNLLHGFGFADPYRSDFLSQHGTDHV